MSDYIVKIIPRDPQVHISDSIANRVLAALQEKILAQRATAESNETPQFIDCGGNLESICCPVCGGPLEFDWWGEQMNIAAKEGFANLEICLPCCGSISSLNDLKYHFPCGFACTELVLWNPAEELSAEDITWIESQLETQVRVIRAHL